VADLSTVEEVMKYLEPERWQQDMEDLYKPTWHILGKSFLHNKKSRGTTGVVVIGIAVEEKSVMLR
jgi:platelet derived growth factor C/D